jgi:hypothetical protein
LKQPGQKVHEHETLSQKNPTQNRAGRVAQVVEGLPSKPEALEFSPSDNNKKKEKWEINSQSTSQLSGSGDHR